MAWYRSRPKDIGGTTATALGTLARQGDPLRSGRSDDRSAANGGLMRAIATGLARPHTATRRQEAEEVSAITHAERRCTQAAIAYCDVANHLVEGAAPADALAWALDESPIDDDVANVLRQAPRTESGRARHHRLRARHLGGGCVGGVLGARLRGRADQRRQPRRGRTTGAVAGGLLGAHYGSAAIPPRWTKALAYGTEVTILASALSELRLENGPRT